VKSPPTVEDYLKAKLLRQALIGFVLIGVVACILTYSLAALKFASDLEETARDLSKAFRTQLIEGDIKGADAGMRELLHLNSEESVQVLNSKLTPKLNSSSALSALRACPSIGVTCFEDFSTGRVFVPIYFDSQGKELFGYLYLARKTSVNWTYVVLVFSVFVFGYCALLLSLLRLNKNSLRTLGEELKSWSNRLSQNPKDETPLAKPPFAELVPLKKAIEGLTSQIGDLESVAGNKAKTLVLRGIAHDLLGPVSQVQLHVASLEFQMDAQPELQEILTDIKDSLKRVSSVAAQAKALNQFAMIGGGIELIDAVKAEVEALRQSEDVMAKNIRLIISAIGEPKTLTSFSAAEISRILSNLVQNAVHASKPSGAVEVVIEPHGGDIALSVRDFGVGISPAIQSRIFEPDFTTKPSVGTGLGLFVVKDLCEKKSARVEVESNLNVGTTVSIIMPRFLNEGVSHAL
jgi:signal transduction histidine kinase